MTVTGHCRYLFNPSEIYRLSPPGQGVETVCGAKTYPAQDVPEFIAVPDADGNMSFAPTGRYLTREHADPHCPRHGGSAEPPPPPVTQAQLDAAEAHLQELTRRSAGQAVTGQTARVALPYSAPEYEPPQYALPTGVSDAQ